MGGTISGANRTKILSSMAPISRYVNIAYLSSGVGKEDIDTSCFRFSAASLHIDPITIT